LESDDVFPGKTFKTLFDVRFAVRSISQNLFCCVGKSGCSGTRSLWGEYVSHVLHFFGTPQRGLVDESTIYYLQKVKWRKFQLKMNYGYQVWLHFSSRTSTMFEYPWLTQTVILCCSSMSSAGFSELGDTSVPRSF